MCQLPGLHLKQAQLTRLPVCQYEYLWADGVKVKRPMKCSAPDYVNQLFDWIESQVRHVSPAES